VESVSSSASPSGLLIIPSKLPSTSVCFDFDEGITCQMIASAGACDMKADGKSLRDICARSCNCCGADQCVCDDNDYARQLASAFGFPWIKSCQHVMEYTTCDHKVYGPLLKTYCPCQCPS
jgi:hypothetical protein